VFGGRVVANDLGRGPGWPDEMVFFLSFDL
jgi:hypothetical protein